MGIFNQRIIGQILFDLNRSLNSNKFRFNNNPDESASLTGLLVTPASLNTTQFHSLKRTLTNKSLSDKSAETIAIMLINVAQVTGKNPFTVLNDLEENGLFLETDSLNTLNRLREKTSQLFRFKDITNRDSLLPRKAALFFDETFTTTSEENDDPPFVIQLIYYPDNIEDINQPNTFIEIEKSLTLVARVTSGVAPYSFDHSDISIDTKFDDSVNNPVNTTDTPEIKQLSKDNEFKYFVRARATESYDLNQPGGTAYIKFEAGSQLRVVDGNDKSHYVFLPAGNDGQLDGVTQFLDYTDNWDIIGGL